MGKISEEFQKINKILQTPITFESFYKKQQDKTASPSVNQGIAGSKIKKSVLPKWSEGIFYPLPQDIEIGLQMAQGKGFCSRYAYARSSDTQDYGDIGQDYLVFNQDREKFVFTLCDGVSQSFFGELAAKFLGDSLSQWLWKLSDQEDDIRNIRYRVKKFLTSLVPKADELVKQHSLASNLPEMLRNVLEQKRLNGSETIFVAGRIDLPCETIPIGRILLVWMGDSRLRLWNPEQTGLIDLEGEFKTEQRWSTIRGPVYGEPQVFTMPFLINGKPAFSLLEAYSDGLCLLDDYRQQPVSNQNIEYLIKQAQAMPTCDDICYLAVYSAKYLEKKPY